MKRFLLIKIKKTSRTRSVLSVPRLALAGLVEWYAQQQSDLFFTIFEK